MALEHLGKTRDDAQAIHARCHEIYDEIRSSGIIAELRGEVLGE